MTTRNQEIAATILKQIGGSVRLSIMTGAKDFVAIENGVQFRFKLSMWNCVRITLDPSDTYTMKFFKIRGVNAAKGPEVNGLYADMLQDTFTEHTGLETHL